MAHVGFHFTCGILDTSCSILLGTNVLVASIVGASPVLIYSAHILQNIRMHWRVFLMPNYVGLRGLKFNILGTSLNALIN